MRKESLFFIRVKDIMEICGCSYVIAFKIRRDVAEFFCIPTRLVTYEHLKRYLKL